MIDLHSHTFFSDGELVPAEHLRRVEFMGYQAIAITDHADSSNLDFIVPRIVQAAKDLNRYSSTKLIPGLELTHVPPGMIEELTITARKLGAKIVVVHGETIVEPVPPGTNLAAIKARVNILAHPGFITEEEATAAATMGVYLELSGRKGHSLTNGHVAKMAARANAKLLVNSDAHGPSDFLSAEMADQVALGAGLAAQDILSIHQNRATLLDSLT